MSKNAISDSGANMHWKPDNPQEMLMSPSNYYYSGFFAGEMTCSVIKASTHNRMPGYYYSVDFTVSNADKNLLEKINRGVMNNFGSISPIKGAFNLKLRGKKKVKVILDFLNKYPILVGDLAKNRIDLLNQALMYLERHRGKNVRHAKTIEIDAIRNSLCQLKCAGAVKNFYQVDSSLSRDAVGYFLSGVLDGEGSFGFKSNGYNTKEPFFAMAMKDQKIVDLLREFIDYGNVRYRRDGVYHYEINKREVLRLICDLFLNVYPSQHKRQRRRLQNIQQILND